MQANDIMVTVLCTAYNHEAFIRETLESFVTQKTDFAFEVLVNDDCSTDNTRDIIREYEEKYPHIIRPFYQPKNLFSQGTNIYAQVFYPEIRGKYVAFCEGDDHWCDENKLQLQVDYLEAHPEKACCVHNTYIHDCAGAIEDKLYVPQGEDREIPFETIIKGMGGAFHTSSIVMKRELVIDPPDFELVADSYRFSDYAIALWAAMNGGVHMIDRTMSIYLVNSNASAWSSGVNGAYNKRMQFVNGEIAMLNTLKPHVEGDWLKAVERTILEREFEQLYLSGRDKELVKPPYIEIYREKPMSFRVKQFIKRTLPFIQRAHRKNRNYGD